jgi:hypothetical protein
VTASIEDERALIEAAQADPARFVDGYDRYVDRVYAYVSRRAGSRADSAIRGTSPGPLFSSWS